MGSVVVPRYKMPMAMAIVHVHADTRTYMEYCLPSSSEGDSMILPVLLPIVQKDRRESCG